MMGVLDRRQRGPLPGDVGRRAADRVAAQQRHRRLHLHRGQRTRHRHATDHAHRCW